MSKLISGIALSLASTMAASSLLAGGLAPASAAADERTAPTLTDFGYRADVYGVKLVTDNVEAFNLKDAHAQLRCTRAIGQSAEADLGPQRSRQPADQHRREHEPHRHLQGR